MWAAKKRGITSIVHFTRRAGLVGIFASSAVKSRHDLPEDHRLKHVYEANADRRLDQFWLNYINLSVTNINMHMFKFSQRKHPDEDWMILEFGPKILQHRGVVFCTTNNIYPSAHRCRGLKGFEQMFAETVPGWYGNELDRRCRLPCETTDPQAEVLYPFELSLKHLHTVTVADDNGVDAVEAALEIYGSWPLTKPLDDNGVDAVEAALSHSSHKPKIKLNLEAFR